MGMASTQARLLSITSRMHDIELQAQNIEGRKIALATQQDAAYEKYCAALDATKITVAYQDEYTKKYVDANFSTMCGFDTGRLKDYSLTNNVTGMVIVDDAVKQAYDNFGNDKYAFAFACMGYEYSDFIANCTECGDAVNISEIGIGTLTQSTVGVYDTNGYGEGAGNCFMNQIERIAFLENAGKYPELDDMYDSLCELCNDDNATQSEKEEALAEFRDKLYSKLGNEILAIMNLETAQDTYDFGGDHSLMSSDHSNGVTNFKAGLSGEIGYYLALWDQINNAGGCEAMDPQYASGSDGTEWLNAMVKSGLVSISCRERGVDKAFEETSVSTSIGRNYLQEEQDDSKVKKAEAEYEHELKVINSKDKKYDNKLNKLETERTALKTEQDAYSTMIKDNIEKTMSIFS